MKCKGSHEIAQSNPRYQASKANNCSIVGLKSAGLTVERVGM